MTPVRWPTSARRPDVPTDGSSHPNNPKNADKPGFGCDGCIRKNLALGEVPTCIFKNVGDTEGWNDWSVEGFARFVNLNRKADA